MRWTWRQFADEVDVLRKRPCLRSASRRATASASGRRIASEWLLTQFATRASARCLVNINPAYRLAELEYALNKVGCKALVAAEQFKTSKYLEMLQSLAPELADAAPNALHAPRSCPTCAP